MNKTLLFIGLFALTGFAACNSKKEDKKEAAKLSATSPVLMDTSFKKEYVAEIQSVQNIEIRAKVKGYLESINVDEGHLVSSGQTLFTIRSREYDAELAEAKAKVKTAELETQNVKILAEKNIVSQTELALSVAKLNEAKAELGIAETNLSFTKITAPFSGIVDRLKFKVGSLVDEGTLLTSLSNNKSVYAYFNVPETEYLSYKTRSDTGNMKSVSLLLANNAAHKYKGIVETVEGQFDNETGNIAFRAKFPNPELLLKHGETGKVQMTIPLKRALIIPQKATYELQDKVYVFVIDKDNRVKSRNITVTVRMQNIYVVGEGLEEGDKILLEGVQNVKDDDKIEYTYVEPGSVISNLQLIKQ
jgi:membrane fusion protein (multidrug efflux system)